MFLVIHFFFGFGVPLWAWGEIDFNSLHVGCGSNGMIFFFNQASLKEFLDQDNVKKLKD
jgi:hypothetical protein